MKKFLVVVEKANGNYSAYAPDLPGCVAAGNTVQETVQLMCEAMQMHVEGLVEDGLPVPDAHSVAEYVVLAETA